MKEYVAHINKNGDKQSVIEHLTNVAKLAGKFAETFDRKESGYYVGMMHDIGKYSAEFQKHILTDNNDQVDHSTAGAKEAINASLPVEALAIAGHHAGLPDIGNTYDSPASTSLIGRCKRNVPDYKDYKKEVTIPNNEAIAKQLSFESMMETRMLFSCLVDADYLDTEQFINSEQREQFSDDLVSLMGKFDAYKDALIANPKNELNSVRSKIIKQCVESGDKLGEGMYQMSLPTGAGKTLDSLAFGLHSAVHNGQDRVIYVIPYNSIIDQTASEYIKILGENNVLEHHSDVEYDENSKYGNMLRLATENWDMPIVITTAVQFFESLFAYKPSKCRKLHNIANSVIVFDEAQTIPVRFLKPCLKAIYELYKNYNCTTLFSTATQPPFETIYSKMNTPVTIKNICEVSEEDQKVFSRNNIKYYGLTTFEKLIHDMNKNNEVLVVVNTKKTALKIYQKINGEHKYLLTTDLTPYDRKNKLKEIKQRLTNNEECVVISTSLVEAGVDIDFPVVYREMAGLDSIYQAAGRCNREGKRSSSECITWYFELQGTSPWKGIAKNISATKASFYNENKTEQMQSYFQYLWYIGEIDEKHIVDMSNKGYMGSMFPFREISEQFRLIDSDTTPVFIQTPQSEKLIDELKYCEIPSKKLIRKLSQYAVNVYSDKLKDLIDNGCVRTIKDAYYITDNPDCYDAATGLQVPEETSAIFI